MKFQKITAEAFAKLCDAVMRRQKLTDDDLQKLAVNAIAYSIDHGDVQPANRLLGAMQRSLRRDSMVKFLEVHGKLAYMKSDEKFAYFKDGRDTYDGDVLMSIKWFEAKKERPIESVYDLQAAFDKFMASVAKKIESKGIDVKNAALFNYLTDAAASYSSETHMAAAEGAEA